MIILLQLAQALTYLHERRICHRDLKPANICLAPNYEVRLVDLGTSKLLKEEEKEVDQTVLNGTYGFMAPEVAVTRKRVGK